MTLRPQTSYRKSDIKDIEWDIAEQLETFFFQQLSLFNLFLLDKNGNPNFIPFYSVFNNEYKTSKYNFSYIESQSSLYY